MPVGLTDLPDTDRPRQRPHNPPVRQAVLLLLRAARTGPQAVVGGACGGTGGGLGGEEFEGATS